jgi:hypothetical protein
LSSMKEVRIGSKERPSEITCNDWFSLADRILQYDSARKFIKSSTLLVVVQRDNTHFSQLAQHAFAS